MKDKPGEAEAAATHRWRGGTVMAFCLDCGACSEDDRGWKPCPGPMLLPWAEFKTMARVIQDHARRTGEDIIGSFLKTGGHPLTEAELVELAKRIESELGG